MTRRTLRLLTVDFTTAQGVAVSRNPGAQVCAEIHQLSAIELEHVVDYYRQDIAGVDGFELPLLVSDPLQLLGIQSSAIFKSGAKAK